MRLFCNFSGLPFELHGSMPHRDTSTFRSGTTLTELVVACTLLGSFVAVVVPATVRVGRLQQSLRQERIALDELTNQLDRISLLPIDQISDELETLKASEPTASSLLTPKLSGEMDESQDGYRIVLNITWDGSGRRDAPLAMSTIVYPKPNPSGEEEPAS